MMAPRYTFKELEKKPLFLALLMGGACVFALYLFEIGLRLTTTFTERVSGADTHRIQAAQAAGLPFDTRSKLEVLEAAWQKKEKLAPALPPAALLARELPFTALRGQGLIPTLYCNESGPWIQYPSDRYGFNNPDSAWNQPIEWAVLGDSFMNGACVEADQTFSAQLKKITGKNTVSLGMASNGPLLMLASLREYVLPARPQVVFWAFYEGNDGENLDYEKTFPGLMRYVEDPTHSEHQRDRSAEIEASLAREIERALQEEREAPRASAAPPSWSVSQSLDWLEGVLKLGRLRRALGLIRPPLDLPLLERVLDRAKRDVEAAGGKLVFLYLPEWRRYQPGAGSNPHRDSVLTVARKLGLKIVDGHEILSRGGDPLSFFPFRTHGHYTAGAYQALAEGAANSVAVLTL